MEYQDTKNGTTACLNLRIPRALEKLGDEEFRKNT